jgi:hypothetical protein
MEAFGPLDMVSSWLPFDQTDYYAAEMGSPLSRRLAAFKDLIDQDALDRAKTTTNAIETAFSLEGRRRVNLDPGYLLAERFVLASGKNHAHRIYIGSGIYADLTLIYRHSGFKPLPWTYPDYRDKRLQQFLLRVRAKYLHDLKQRKVRS